MEAVTKGNDRDKKLKVLVGLVHPLRTGGIAAAEHPLLDELRSRPDVNIVTVPFGSRSESESRPEKVTRLARDLARFAAVLKRESPDVVHINSAFDRRALIRDTGYAFVAGLMGYPLFVKLHGSDVRLTRTPTWGRRWMTRYIVRKSARIGVLSTEERNNFLAAGHAGGKFVVVKNSIDLQKFGKPRMDGVDCPEVLFIARFVPSKGLLELLHALHIVLDSGRKVHLTCIGDGVQMRAARNLVQELGIERAVSFEGYIPESETSDFYLRATMLVLPTKTEGFSMTIFQAVAAGLPVITSRIRAAADYLSEPANCLWAEPGDVRGIAARIIELLDNAQLRTDMSKNNRTLAFQFSPKKIADEYVALYRELAVRR